MLILSVVQDAFLYQDSCLINLSTKTSNCTVLTGNTTEPLSNYTLTTRSKFNLNS